MLSIPDDPLGVNDLSQLNIEFMLGTDGRVTAASTCFVVTDLQVEISLVLSPAPILEMAAAWMDMLMTLIRKRSMASARFTCLPNDVSERGCVASGNAMTHAGTGMSWYAFPSLHFLGKLITCLFSM